MAQGNPNDILMQADAPVKDEKGKVVGNDRTIVYADGRMEVWRSTVGQDPEQYGSLITKGINADVQKAWREDQKPQTLVVGGKVFERDANGTYTLKLDTSTAEAKPAEGATRPNVRDGYTIQEVYRGGSWVVDPSVPPTRYIPQDAKPAQEGDTRPNVVDGYAVRQVYRGGQWTIDPSVPPRKFVPDNPKDPTIVKDDQGNPYVWDAASESYKPAPGIPGARPKQPQLVQGGDGNWYQWDESANDSQGGFVRSAIPGAPPSVVSAPADNPTLVQRDPATGALTSVPNPAYVPKDPRERVQQLQALATRERDRLLVEVNEGRLDPTKARDTYTTWWQEHVAGPMEAARASAAETVRTAQEGRATAELGYEANRQAAGRTAGQEAVRQAQATLPYRVGPAFGEDFSKALSVLSGGGGPVSFRPEAFTFTMPNFEQISREASQRAIAQIKPFADAMAGINLPTMPKTFNLDDFLAGLPPVQLPGQPAIGQTPS